MPLPGNVSFGHVVGRYTQAIADTPDGGEEPDALPAVGTVTFTASVTKLINTSATPPATIIPRPVICDLDVDGEISLNGTKGVYLLATDDPDLTPVDWTWGVTVAITGGPPIAFDMELASDAEVDLTTVTPVSSSGGTPIIQGPPGVTIVIVPFTDPWPPADPQPATLYLRADEV